jgi:hypothetical protein
MNTKTQPTTTPNLVSAVSAVHCVGSEIGQVRLDCQFTQNVSMDEARKFLSVSIPGELGPLRPVAVKLDRQRLVVGFFSSDIANSGHKPAAMSVNWETEAGTVHLGDATIRSATAVEQQLEGGAAAVPGSDSVYPRTVALLPMFALVLGILFTICALIMR